MQKKAMVVFDNIDRVNWVLIFDTLTGCWFFGTRRIVAVKVTRGNQGATRGD